MIDCGGSAGEPHTGFIADQGESTFTVLMQVGIENGYSEYGGGGLVCAMAGEVGGCPIIDGCGFVNCTAAEDGGAIVLYQYAHPVITGCWFTGNSAGEYGGAIYGESGTALAISGCEFEGNSAYRGGAVSADACLVAMSSCRFVGNRSTGAGGAVYGYLASVELTNCTSIGNRSLSNGGSIYALFAGSASSAGLYIVGSSFIADSSEAGGVIACGGATGSLLVEETVVAFGYNSMAVQCFSPIGTISLACCDIFGNALGDWVNCIAVQAGASGNFSQDPKFCNIKAGHGGVESCSPCLPGGNSCGQLIGAWTTFCECGYATVPTTWGAIKASFK
jgi:predicted outer membrane repeat protein